VPAEDLLELLDMLNQQMGSWISGAVGADEHPQRSADDAAGSRPNTALAYVLTIGDVRRFNGASRWRVIWG